MAISSYKQSDTPGTKVEDKAPRIRSHITEWGWKDEWWTARRELRLTVRAECHYS